MGLPPLDDGRMVAVQLIADPADGIVGDSGGTGLDTGEDVS
jgi:hypothetical protein